MYVSALRIILQQQPANGHKEKVIYMLVYLDNNMKGIIYFYLLDRGLRTGEETCYSMLLIEGNFLP